jgi:AbrB family looped-hinge helix DNA binding protein
MVLTISNKGWVVIPAELRKKYNLHAGSKVVIVDYGGVLSIVPAVKDPIKAGDRRAGRRPQSALPSHRGDPADVFRACSR